jgi:hypothetical protein
MEARDRRSFPCVLPLVPGVAAVLLWLGIGLLLRAANPAAGSTVYTVAALRTHLLHAPAAWDHRTVRVRAMYAARCLVWATPNQSTPLCVSWQSVLVDAGPSAYGALPLVRGTASPLLLFLRHLPVLARLAPEAQVPLWETPAIYRIQLRATRCDAGALPPCYEAVLPDAAPGLL